MVSIDFVYQKNITCLMRAEIPLDYNSGESENYLKVYRNADVGRSQRWKEVPYLIVQTQV